MTNKKIVLKEGTHSIVVAAYECPECGRIEIAKKDENKQHYCDECSFCGYPNEMLLVTSRTVPLDVWDNSDNFLWEIVDDGFDDAYKCITFSRLLGR